MNKQKSFFGKAFVMLGSPAALGLAASINSLSFNGKTLDLLWSVPLTVVSFPLLPLVLIGESILKEVELEEFSKKTKGMEKVSLPLDYAYIEKSGDGWLVHPFAYEDEEEPFETEDDARLFLQCLHYHEVLSVDTERPITFWIKDDPDTRSEKL